MLDTKNSGIQLFWYLGNQNSVKTVKIKIIFKLSTWPLWLRMYLKASEENNPFKVKVSYSVYLADQFCDKIRSCCKKQSFEQERFWPVSRLLMICFQFFPNAKVSQRAWGWHSLVVVITACHPGGFKSFSLHVYNVTH